MLRRTASLCVLLLLSASALVSGTAGAETLLNTYSPPVTNFEVVGFPYGYDAVAVPFIPNTSTTITSIKLDIAGGLGTVLVGVMADATVAPSQGLSSSVPSGTFLNVVSNLSPPIGAQPGTPKTLWVTPINWSVQANKKYWLVVSPDSNGTLVLWSTGSMYGEMSTKGGAGWGTSLQPSLLPQATITSASSRGAKLFGIAIGQNDLVGVRGDKSAQEVFRKLSSQPHWASAAEGNTTAAYTITGVPDLRSPTIEANDIIGRLNAMQVQQGDTVVFYVNVHGGHVDRGTPEALVRADQSDPTGRMDEALAFGLDDDDLKQYFSSGKWQGVRKIFFLDTCHSGGFFGPNDPNDAGDLEKLSNAAVFAAAQEWEEAPVSSILAGGSVNEVGMGVWTLSVLLPALNNAALTTTQLVSKVFSPTIFPVNYLRYIGEDLYLLDGVNPPGSHAIFQGNTPFFAATDDFDLDVPLLPRTTVDPPFTEITTLPEHNALGWNQGSVTMTLSATDTWGPGVSQLRYSLDGAQTGGAVVSADNASLIIDKEGITTVTYFASDSAGNQEEPKTVVVKIDRTPPAITGLPTNCSLWPPNLRFVNIGTVSASDAGAGLTSFDVTGTSNEPSGSGESDIRIQGTALGWRNISLKADRYGTGTGRLYSITANARDLAGNNSELSATCVVPHDLRK